MLNPIRYQKRFLKSIRKFQHIPVLCIGDDVLEEIKQKKKTKQNNKNKKINTRKPTQGTDFPVKTSKQNRDISDYHYKFFNYFVN